MRIPHGVLKIANCAAEETTRYSFSGVRLARNGDECEAAATDGRVMVMAKWNESDIGTSLPFDVGENRVASYERVVPADAAMAAAEHGGVAHLDESAPDGSVALVFGNERESIRREVPSVEGGFPPCHEVIPEYKIVEADFSTDKIATRISVDANLMIKMLRGVLDANQSSESGAVTLEIPLQPNRIIKATRGPDELKGDRTITVVGVVMPFRVEYSTKSRRIELGGCRSDNLTFAALRKANTARLPLFKNRNGDPAHSAPDGSDWCLGQWCNAVCGELGEAANLIKKIERGDMTLDEARANLGRELADVQTYLDILAFRAGIDLGAATAGKFNEVSDRVGCDVRLRV